MEGLQQRLLRTTKRRHAEPHAEQAHCSRPTLPPTLTCDTASVPTLSFSPRDLDHFHPPRCQPSVARRCVDLSPVATIRDENREAAPRPRRCGVLNRTHTRARSLAKLSAGISNPCGYIDQPARARWWPLAPAGQRNNHYTSSAPELTHVLVHWLRCLQGFRIPAVISTSRPVPDSTGW